MHLVNTAMAAKYAGVSQETIKRWRREGFLEAKKHKHDTKYHVFDLEAVMACKNRGKYHYVATLGKEL